MQTSVRDNYLTTEVMTATPQKLQLMLLEAAIRFARLAQSCWQQQQDEQAGEAILRCQEIVGEVLGGLRPDRDPQLVRRVAGIYMFIFRALTNAHLRRDQASLADALRILDIERETWKQVCARLGSSREAEAPAPRGGSFVA